MTLDGRDAGLPAPTALATATTSLAESGAPVGARPSLPVGTRLGRYELTSVVGVGGMGVVFAARDPELDRVVAVKVLHPHGSASATGELRLRREGQTMARLNHPNVIRVYDVGAARGNLFVAMEFVAGGTLESWLTGAPRSPAEIIATFAQAGRGLAAAHDAGLVHRDFKPSNVMVGDDGRVLVTDFGLARPLATDPDAAASPEPAVDPPVPAPAPALARGSGSPSPPPLATITHAGGRVGTPGYMAPEQQAGAQVDARANQFSFCVALWRALFDDAPYADSSALEATAPDHAAVALTPPRAERAARVPARVRAALARGLAPSPDARFPSMHELLAALAAAPTAPRRRTRALAIAVAALGVGGALAWALLGRGGEAAAGDPCASRGDRFAGVWDGRVAAAVHDAFAATHVAYAEASYREVERQLDLHRRGWETMRRDSCLATRVRGEQSDAMMDLRAACLDHRLGDLAAYVTVLRAADARVVREATPQAAAVGDVSACADVATLTRRAPLPADPARRATIDAIERDVAAARARFVAGHYTDDVAQGAALVARARAAGYAPVLAEALWIQAKATARADRAAEAEPELEEAVLAAEAGGDDVLRFDAETALTTVDGYQLEHDGDAQRHAQRAQALLTRLGPDPGRAGLLAHERATVDWWNGRYAEARARAQESIDQYARVDPDGVGVGRSLHLRAIVEQEMGDALASVATEGKALAILERTLGADHPSVAQSLETEGGSLRTLGRLDEAARALERGLAVIEKSEGLESGNGADALTNLGILYQDREEYARALEVDQRAVDINTRRLGADHSRVADGLEALGNVLAKLGRGDQAVVALTRAIEIHRARLGPDAPPTASSVRHLGEYYLEAAQPARARPLLVEAVRALEASQGKTSPMLANPLVTLGDAERALHHGAAATASYQRALAVIGSDPHYADLRARATAGLGGAPSPSPSPSPSSPSP